MKNLILNILLLIPITLFAQDWHEEERIYEYDDLNRLTKVFFFNGTVHEYVYDNLGNRTQRLVYEAPKTYVPDDAFEQHLINQGYDNVLDDYVYTHRIDDVDYLFMNGLGIVDLTGIEDFETLETLHCSNNELTIIDISNNVNLKHLYCSHNSLTSLDITALNDLSTLECSYNDLSNLDLSNNLFLEHIGIASTLVETVDLSNHPEVVWFEALNGQLVSLNLENGNNNNITYMHTGNNPNLYCIQVDDENAANNGTGVYANWQTDSQVQYSYNCSLTYVPDDAFEQYLINIGYDVVLNDYAITPVIDNIEVLDMNNLGIQDLTGIEDFHILKILRVGDNVLTSIDISNNPNLMRLVCDNNMLTELDVSNNFQLLELFFSENSITDLDITNNTELTYLSGGLNNLYTVNLASNPNLKYIYLASNNLTEIDVSNNPNVEVLNVSGNQLTNLDVSQNPNLNTLRCSSNQLTSMDISLNPNLVEFKINHNQLLSLNTKSNFNNSLIDFRADNNPDLYCIQVDDENAAINGLGVYANWIADNQVEYSEDCNYSYDIDYVVSATSLSCVNSLDGKIQVSTSDEEYSFIVQVESQENNYNENYNLNSDTNWDITVENLFSGEYIVNITIEDIPETIYKKTYILNIQGVEAFSTNFWGNAQGRFVNMEGGTPPYTVKVNHQIILETNDTSFSFQADHGDLIEIVSSISCEGKFIKVINDIDGVTMFPNPTEGQLVFRIEQSISRNIEQINIKIFDSKEQEDILVVDFTNNAKEIFNAFNKHRKGSPFREKEPDKDVLVELYEEIKKQEVFTEEDIELYTNAFIDAEEEAQKRNSTPDAILSNLNQKYREKFKQTLSTIEAQKAYVGLLRRYKSLFYFMAKFFKFDQELTEFVVFAEAMSDILIRKGKTSEMKSFLEKVELSKGAIKYHGKKTNLRVEDNPVKKGLKFGKGGNAPARTTIETAIAEIENKYQISKDEVVVIKEICTEVSGNYEIKERVKANKDNKIYLSSTAKPKIKQEVKRGYIVRDMVDKLEDPIYSQKGGIISLMGNAIIKHILTATG